MLVFGPSGEIHGFEKKTKKEGEGVGGIEFIMES